MSPFKNITVTACALFGMTLHAQSSLEYTATAEGAFGDGDFTPYFLSSNRHGVLSTKANTGYVRYALTGEYTGSKMTLSGGADVQVSAHDYTTFYLQQLYLSLRWRWLYFDAGSREYAPMMRNQELSSGSTVWSGNARPIPQLRVGTNDFLTIPGTKQWLQIYFDGGYGHFIDCHYMNDRYDTYTEGKVGAERSFITTDAWYHQKKIFFRSNPNKRWVVTAGMEHAVQFGGKSTIDTRAGEERRKYKVGFQEFMRVLIPTAGDSESAGGDQNFVYGNHLGNIQCTVEYKPTAEQHWSAYVENLYEDGSGMAKRNGWDGLWGLEYRNERGRWLRGVVLEYLQTCDQSGPIHWAPSDWSDEIQSSLPSEARGADDYYNNYFYNGYAHYGMACGSPMLMSPRYNRDSYLRFTDTRVRGYHLGLSGQPSTHWSYRLLASYRQSWGTPFVPAIQMHHTFNAMLEASYTWQQWKVTGAYALDRGNLYGDNTGFSVSISRSGKLL